MDPSDTIRSFSDFRKKRGEKAQETNVTPVKISVKRLIMAFVVTILFGLVYFYVALPAINIQDPEFYVFVFLLCGVFSVVCLVGNLSGVSDISQLGRIMKKTVRIPLLICIALIGVYLVGSLAGSVFFRASAYKQLLPVESGDFTADVEQISFDIIPMLDKASAERLGDRKLGELADVVSQFEVESDYNQVNYKDRPVRLATLRYGDVFKWLSNRKNGLPAYIIVDMVSQNVEVVRLDPGMKYSPADHFSRYLYRHLRFQYPTFMFDTAIFEIDDEGAPYWICPRVVKTIGLFGGSDIKGAVMVNAVTGESTYYEELPTWVDRVYPAELIMQQYDYYGLYQNGFWNSMIGQRDVTVTTDGYNYIAMNDDVYMYTGITSVGGDQSNLGFVLTNLRTKDTRYYPCAGATEYSAMASARGIVQHLNYEATFPLLLNVANEPTYFMALKDNAGLVKMYAMVNVQQYHLVATAATVTECEKEYEKLLAQNGIGVQPEGESQGPFTAEGTVEEIRSAVINGFTTYYFRLNGETVFYGISAAEDVGAVIISVGDTVVITASSNEGSIRLATKIEKK